MKLAWAVTIHKSQGKTFDKVMIDFGFGTFAHGQAYVALSRCTSFGGMGLAKPLKKQHILMDRRVSDFVTKYQYKISEANMPFDKKMEMIQEAIKNSSRLEMTYLKKSDEKTKRSIRPVSVGEMEYANRKFIGVKAHCFERDEPRTFRVDRILEMKIIM